METEAVAHDDGKNPGPYRACHTSKDEPPFVYGVAGPGDGLGHHAWYGHPRNTFATFEEAEKAARLMNLAFREGEKHRGREIARLIGS